MTRYYPVFSDEALTKQCDKAIAFRPAMDSYGFRACADVCPGICGHADRDCFVWFTSLPAMLDFLGHCITWMFSSLWDDEWESVHDQAGEVVHCFEGHEMEGLRDALNPILKGYVRIAWAGTFRDLCDSDHPYALAFRESFRDMLREDDNSLSSDGSIDGTDDGIPPSGEPIDVTDEETVNQFVEFMRRYGR